MQLVSAHKLDHVLRRTLTHINAAPYSLSTTDTVSGLSSPEFMNTFGMSIPSYTAALKFYLKKILTDILAFLFLTMAILMLIFMICATRTNVVYTLIFLSLILVFLLLTAGYWQSAEGNASVGGRCVKVSGSPAFTIRDLKYEVLIHMYFLYREPELHCSSRVCLVFIC